MGNLQERYAIVKELGRGGMGVVYKAQDRMLGRVVAIKRLLEQGNRLLIDRFLGEAKSIAALNHANIIQIYDIGRDQEGLYIITEFVDGLDLEKLIGAKGKLPLKVAMKLILPICRALQYAHERGVIHRDIKPANVLLTNAGEPKIADFGLARLDSMKDLEKTGMIMGTRSYASPEQFKDAKHLDHRTDIYSVGAMFYEMLTGASPQFFRETDLPPAFRPIILKAMARDPENRYPNLTEMLREMGAAFQTRQTPADQAPPPSPSMVRPAPGVPSAVGGTASLVAAAQTELVLVPAGEFLFGQQAQRAELPAFLIDKYPVTNAQFARLKPAHRFPPGEENHPATNLTWLEANAYARQVGKRLPSEAEWEKAARGTDGRNYPWGNHYSPELCNTFESRIGSSTPVDAYPDGQSPCGVMDLAGNVWEWTSTYLNENQTARVLKGGAFNGEAKFALAFARFAYPEKGSLPTAGFRCVRTAE